MCVVGGSSVMDARGRISRCIYIVGGRESGVGAVNDVKVRRGSGVTYVWWVRGRVVWFRLL